MHSKCDKIEIIINDEEDKVMKELFNSHKKRHQNNLELMKGSEFFFIMLFNCIINAKK